MHRPGVEPAIFRTLIRRPNHYTTEQPGSLKMDLLKIKCCRNVAYVAESNAFVCTFEDDSCPLYDSSDSDENWIKVDGWLSHMTDNTLNRGINYTERYDVF